MDPIIAAALIELGKTGIMLAFQELKLAGMKDEEIKQAALDTHTAFLALPDATTLPEVPE